MEELESLGHFLVDRPPLSSAKIKKLVQVPLNHSSHATRMSMPPIVLHCESENCKGDRIFRCSEGPYLSSGLIKCFVEYRCSNCHSTQKIYAISFEIDGGETNSGVVLKIGELPPYGPPIPSKAISLVGPDRELFLKGRRAENQGLGIAAFAYYRRIIENQWQRLLDEISKVGAKTGLDPAIQQHIEVAKKERQFDKAVKSMGDAIPPALKMNGQNPIALLYSALSEGIHAQSDEECLEIAGHIRVILYELAERLNTALQEHNELDAAVKRLANRKNPTPKPEA